MPDNNANLPALPSAIKDAEASKDILHNLRHFHLGNPGVKEKLERLGDDFLPALLAPYRDASGLRYDYPLFLYPPEDGDGALEPSQLAKPVAAFLEELLETIAPGAESARILKDNLARLEHGLHQALDDSESPVDARGLLGELGAEMLQGLGLDGESSAKLQDDLDRLVEAIPQGGQLLSYGKYPAILLMIHTIRSMAIPRQAHFQEQLQEQILGLDRLLEVERAKSEEGRAPKHLEESIGGGAGMFDASALSQVMAHSQGSVGMSGERRSRVEHALATLRAYQQEATLVRFVHLEALDASVFADIPSFQSVVSDNPCVRAKELFDAEASRLAKVFAAVRIAQLELEDRYDEAIHDPWFENFNWEAFSQEELLLVPAVIALETADRVAGEAMADFSHLLNSGRPVQVLVRVLGHANPGRATDEDPFAHFRTELGYLGIAHRQAVVSQTSAARHEHLLTQFTTALKATRTGLHIINVGMRPLGQGVGLNGWLVAGAALEGRVHPFFQINPAAGDSFADRMTFDGNPQPEKDWALHPFQYRDENGETVEQELAFTFADYALLIPRLHKHFTPVPLVCESDAIVSMADYLTMDEEQAAEHIPYIWAINAQGALRQLAVSRLLVHACRDRLNYWHSLQEMAGVRSRYLELGIAAAREEIAADYETRRLATEASHQQQLVEVRTEAAGAVMGRLTEVLMGMDFTGAAPRMAAAPAAESTAPAAEPAAAEAPAAEEPVEEEEELSFDEAWIDSPLCTTCNDCLAINPQLFVYNDSNQAIITDPKLGTFAHLVEAAEICPSKCIHPGKPLDGSEAGLDELIERAAPFN